MPAPKSKPAMERKRKAHKKSRAGCSNCKLRRVRCDETRPTCVRCRNGALLCNYTSTYAMLQSSHEHKVTSQIMAHRCSTNQTMLDHLNGVMADFSYDAIGEYDPYQLDMPDLECLSRFYQRTMIESMPPKIGDVYKKESLRLMATNAHLLHMSIVLTAMHDRYLALQSGQQRTPQECFHWNKALRYFNEDLTMKFNSESNLDAIWMTAVLMCWGIIFSIETNDSQQCWPLKESESSDLSWLGLQKGLKALWDRIQAKPGDVYWLQSAKKMPPTERCLGLPLPSTGLDGILPSLITLCDLDESATALNNPYYTAAHVLSTLLSEPKKPQAIRFMWFPNTIEPQFEALLRKLDPYAMVLLALWYEMVKNSMWWMRPRAVVGHKAIMTYLRRYHMDNPRIVPFIGAFSWPYGGSRSLDYGLHVSFRTNLDNMTPS